MSKPSPSPSRSSPPSPRPSPAAAPPSRRRARALVFGAGVLVVAAATYRGAFFCPTARYLRFACPACGSTRAVRAMVDLDVDEMLRTNPIAPAIVVVLSAFVARAAWLLWKDGSASHVAEGRTGAALTRALAWCFALELVVWALRAFGFFGGPVNV